MNDDIEKLAEAVHDAYLRTCDRLGWDVRPENRVPYADLTEDSKELDRASVRAVLAGIESEEDDAASAERSRLMRVVEAARELADEDEEWWDPVECKCDDSVGHTCERCWMLRKVRKVKAALSDLDKEKKP